ncbi:MAG: hypothetical protein ACTHMZ_12950 [Actinomycetes bacterium]
MSHPAGDSPLPGVWYRPDSRRADGFESTSAVGRAVFAAAAAAGGSDASSIAAAIEREGDWRRRYARHVRDLTVAAAGAGSDVAAAAAALDAAAEHLLYQSGDGAEADVDEPPQTTTFVGGGARETSFSLPWHGGRLREDELSGQLAAWQDAGVLEPSAADAVRAVIDHPEWLDLDDLDFVVVGAGAEMAPTLSLLRWGARVTAVDVPATGVWERLVAAAGQLAGTLVVPLQGEGAGIAHGSGSGAEGAPRPGGAVGPVLGLDVRRAPGAVGALAVRVARRPVFGNYVYADGRAFPPLQQAVDLAWERARSARPEAACAMLATPTDVFLAPPDAVEVARARFAARGWRRLAQAPLRAATGLVPAARLFRPAYRRTVDVPDGRRLGVADSLVVQQGPNYALAKQLQRWRALVEFDAGRVVSANVAPPTRTRSVVRNRVLAAAYAGAGRFGVEVFAPATSSALMAALLVHDLRAPRPVLGHPQDLFANGAVHGGLWRVPYEPRSVLGLAVGAGLLARR